ncbi:hypothetical protein [Pseudomonas moorei]|uniref:hypothetical protein n=1 Tax=Pseudomonas moorei TaxID=395599 RepID=UPI0020108833|nr:hypothetical protein [Pseudomonas moorei]
MDTKSKLSELGVPKELLVLAQSLIAALAPVIDFFSDEWCILEWRKRPGNLSKLTLYFSRFQNKELMVISKLYVAAGRIQNGTADGAASSIVCALLELDSVIGNKSIRQLSSLDFVAVENKYIERGVTGKVTCLTVLQAFSKWLCRRVGLRVLYNAPKNREKYGRHGSEKGREQKLLPTEILRDLFRLAKHPDVDFRDKFFIHALVIDTALGCRINELACLPLDCLVQQNGKWVLKLFPEKGGRLFYRLFPQEMYPAVKAAVDFITEHTEAGRNIVRKLRLSPGVDWSKVKKSSEAIIYYTRKFAADWIREHSLYTPEGSYYYTTGQFVNAVQLLKRFGSSSVAADYLGTSIRVFEKLLACQKSMRDKVYLYEKAWNELAPLTCETENWRRVLRKNPHSVKVSSMEETCQVIVSQQDWMRRIVDEVLDEALMFQLLDKPYKFERMLEFEREFEREILPTIRENGVTLLEPEDSLFVVPRNFLLRSRVTRTNDFVKVTEGVFERWLECTSEGDKSLFKMFNVLDPRTGGVAEFVWHDIRHWLNTTYKQGGLSDAQVNLILGRSDYRQGQVYDHTPALSRSRILQQMMVRVREDKAVGLIQTTFNKLKIENRKTAEEYLNAAVRVINPMPHGGCAHNLALKPCQHSLSCLAKGSNGEPCEELIVDAQDETQRREIETLSRNAKVMQIHLVNAGGGSSPQLSHFENVERSANFLLEQIFKKN